jgi:hypothetical protein
VLEIKSGVSGFPNSNQRNTWESLSKAKSFTSAEDTATDLKADKRAHSDKRVLLIISQSIFEHKCWGIYWVGLISKLLFIRCKVCTCADKQNDLKFAHQLENPFTHLVP